jgi:hypothetical protein
MENFKKIMYEQMYKSSVSKPKKKF